MAGDTSRIMIRTYIKSALKDADEAPERCTRKLVDMALNFAHGRFQQQFFEIAQTMLSNEQSPYYPMIEDLLKHVDKNRLLNFGMNIGYNGCTMGAHIIRHMKRTENLAIPWLLPVETGDPDAPGMLDRCNSLIKQGKDLGIYIYFLITGPSPQKLIALAEQNPDCAFILMCSADLVDEALAVAASEPENLMIGVKYGKKADAACLLLRNHRLLYSLYFVCSDTEVSSVTSGKYFHFAEEMHSTFSAILPTFDCSGDARQKIYQAVLHSRTAQVYRTMPLDLASDTKMIGNMISPPDCTVGFRKDGQLYGLNGPYNGETFNYFSHSLREIFSHPAEVCCAQ